MSSYYPGDTTNLTKAQIAATEGGNTTPVEAYFNPDKLSITKPVQWAPHAAADTDAPPVEFTKGSAQTLTVTLTFDGFETATDVYTEYVSKLMVWTLIDSDLKRPPLCTFTWGSSMGGPFKGVIQNLKVDYTMFLPNGSPCRASVTLTMTQADKAMSKEEAKAANKKAAQKSGKTAAGATAVGRNQTATSPQGQDAERDSMGRAPAGSTIANK